MHVSEYQYIFFTWTKNFICWSYSSYLGNTDISVSNIFEDLTLSYRLLNNFKASKANRAILRKNRTKILSISGTVLLILRNALLIWNKNKAEDLKIILSHLSYQINMFFNFFSYNFELRKKFKRNENIMNNHFNMIIIHQFF